MIWYLIGIFLTIIVVGILKDTHYVYYRDRIFIEESEIEIPLWILIIIFLVELAPLFNIILFIIFALWYIKMSYQKPSYWGNTYVFNLRGENWIGRAIIMVRNFLNTKI